MDPNTAAPQDPEVQAVLLEIAKVRETADRMDRGDLAHDGGNSTQVIAGLLHQLAEQTERLVLSLVASTSEDRGGG